jgi:hypothetical protein
MPHGAWVRLGHGHDGTKQSTTTARPETTLHDTAALFMDQGELVFMDDSVEILNP